MKMELRHREENAGKNKEKPSHGFIVVLRVKDCTPHVVTKSRDEMNRPKVTPSRIFVYSKRNLGPLKSAQKKKSSLTVLKEEG